MAEEVVVVVAESDAHRWHAGKENRAASRTFEEARSHSTPEPLLRRLASCAAAPIAVPVRAMHAALGRVRPHGRVLPASVIANLVSRLLGWPPK